MFYLGWSGGSGGGGGGGLSNGFAFVQPTFGTTITAVGAATLNVTSSGGTIAPTGSGSTLNFDTVGYTYNVSTGFNFTGGAISIPISTHINGVDSPLFLHPEHDVTGDPFTILAFGADPGGGYGGTSFRMGFDNTGLTVSLDSGPAQLFPVSFSTGGLIHAGTNVNAPYVGINTASNVASGAYRVQYANSIAIDPPTTLSVNPSFTGCGCANYPAFGGCCAPWTFTYRIYSYTYVPGTTIPVLSTTYIENSTNVPVGCCPGGGFTISIDWDAVSGAAGYFITTSNDCNVCGFGRDFASNGGDVGNVTTYIDDSNGLFNEISRFGTPGPYTPTFWMDDAGHISIGGSHTDAVANFRSESGSSEVLLLRASTPMATNYFRVLDSTNTSLMVLNSLGYLGINNASPSGNLDIGAISNSVTPFQVRGHSGQASALAKFYDSGGTVLDIIDASGNVGIGTGSGNPTARLQLGAGSTSVAPLKLTSGTLTSAISAGSGEYNGNFYLSNSAMRFPVGGTLFDHFTNAGNTTTTETTLYTDTLVANTFKNNGDKVTAEYGGVFVSSATATRQVRVYFAGTAILDTGALTLTLSSAWTAYVSLIRVSSSVVRYMISLTTEGAALAAYTAVGELTGLTLTGTNILKITGQAAGTGAATNDIVAKMGNVQFLPAA